MNGPEHYREAERILARTAQQIRAGGGLPPGEAMFNAAAAQARATLALAAATAAAHDPLVVEEPSFDGNRRRITVSRLTDWGRTFAGLPPEPPQEQP